MAPWHENGNSAAAEVKSEIFLKNKNVVACWPEHSVPANQSLTGMHGVTNIMLQQTILLCISMFEDNPRCFETIGFSMVES